MKNPYLLPVATAVIGFAAAWFVKPAGTPEKDKLTSSENRTEGGGVPKPGQGEDNGRTRPGTGKGPAEVKAGDFPLAEQFEKGPQTRQEAKMLRLTEALGLSTDQQAGVTGLMETVGAAESGNGAVIEDLTRRGKMIEEGLQKLLTPEQWAKFQEIRERERENRTEVRAQQMLLAAMQEIDISPGQRDELISRLRQKSKMDMQSIPAAATLLLDKSLLPTGKQELSVDGVLMLAKMAEPVELADPGEVHDKVKENQKREIEEILRCFDGILTTGQMGQYQAGLAEQRALVNRLPKSLTQVPDVPILEDPVPEGPQILPIPPDEMDEEEPDEE